MHALSMLLDNPVRSYCPWAHLLGAFGGILLLISAFRHLFNLSLNKGYENIRTHQTHGGAIQDILAQHPLIATAPPECVVVEMESPV
jgi:hypothetical protein